MNKTLISSLTAAALFAGTPACAQTIFTQTSSVTLGSDSVVVNSGQGRLSGFLNTDFEWQTIEIPNAAIGNVAPEKLSLTASGLPEGLSISLERATQVGGTLILNVNVERSPFNAVPSGLARVTLLAGGAALTSFQVSVQNVPYLSK